MPLPSTSNSSLTFRYPSQGEFSGRPSEPALSISNAFIGDPGMTLFIDPRLLSGLPLVDHDTLEEEESYQEPLDVVPHQFDEGRTGCRVIQPGLEINDHTDASYTRPAGQAPAFNSGSLAGRTLEWSNLVDTPPGGNISSSSGRGTSRAYRVGEGEGDDAYEEDDNDDDYKPSGSKSKKWRVSRVSAPPRRTTRQVTKSSKPPFPRRPPSAAPTDRAKRPRLGPPAAQRGKAPLSKWKCPYCPFVQPKQRMPDLRRHIYAHERQTRTPEWVCRGVPLELARDYDIVDTTQMTEWNGRQMVGGCQREFSRRDALMRHLRNKTGHCAGWD